MLELSVNVFLDELASTAPVPGGGSVAGLLGALSTSLGSMACNLSYGKKSVLDKKELTENCIEKLSALTNEFKGLSERDAEVFRVLSAAYGIKAIDEKEKAEKAAVLENALVNACSVPYDTLMLTREMAELLSDVRVCSTKLMVSDVFCAASVCETTAKCAYINVLANTRLMKNREHAEETNAKALDCRDGVLSAVHQLMTEIEGVLQ